MAISTVTSKGQVTIPKKVRDRLRLQTGDRIDFRIEADGAVRIYPIAKKVSEVFGAFSGKASEGRSPAEMKAGVQRAFKERKL
ncbi:MAG: AbrB/MazE/SpoVT family DNA-binding domain-containing protein [Myxococcota bacterium]